jgi:hypothetical protein
LRQIAAYPRSARKRQDRPVTPEVAGSSPVAPAKVPANRHLLLPGLAQSTAGLPTDPALIPHAGSKCDSGPVKGWKWPHFCCSSRHRPTCRRSSHPAQIPREKRAVTGKDPFCHAEQADMLLINAADAVRLPGARLGRCARMPLETRQLGSLGPPGAPRESSAHDRLLNDESADRPAGAHRGGLPRTLRAFVLSVTTLLGNGEDALARARV